MKKSEYVMEVEIETSTPHGQIQPKTNIELDSRFDRIYRNLGSTVKPEKKRIDYVLVHPSIRSEDEEDEDDKLTLQKKEHMREEFEKALRKEGFYIHTVKIGNNVYKKLHCPFRRLCEEAEKVNLELPIDPGYASENKNKNKNKNPHEIEKQESEQCCGSFRRWYRRTFEPEEPIDYESTPFVMDRVHIFKGHQDPSNFFRPALRSLLVQHILINLNIRDKLKKHIIDEDADVNDDETSGLGCGCSEGDIETPEERQKRKALQKIAFPYLKYKEVYTESMILHEHSNRSALKEDLEKTDKTSEENKLENDPRLEMDDTWTVFYKFQPLNRIRNYFGEKIAFYFAWSGLLIQTLWLPTVFGLCIFFYGLYLSINKSNHMETTTPSSNTTETTTEKPSVVTDLLSVIKNSFDNEVTPYFALVICVWGTVFLELWKRKSNRLAYIWDVQEFESNEPDRPEFFGTETREDPVSGETAWYFPLRRQMTRFTFSCMTMTFMVLLVLTSVLSVIIYRVITSVDYCPNLTSTECLLATTVVSSILNTVSILILGKAYDWLAVKLTNLENHRTQTMYDDALIIKLFAFQFANNYASCFYIAFFRGRFDYTGILELGSQYRDSCEGTCMSQLSFQILTLMIAKPLPKLFSDVVLPWLKRKWRNRPACCWCCCCKADSQGDKDDPAYKAKHDPKSLSFLEKELLKDKLGDFTMGEYTEKIIQYGFLMLFAASLPLAPLLALLLLLFDIRVDAKRMLWWYRRPVAKVAQDIGTWFTILQFMNFAGVVSNGFLIAFTSSWGQQYTTMYQLWIVVGFEHIVFMLKFLLSYLIPDIPDDVALAIRRHQHWRTHRLTKILGEDRKQEAKEMKAILESASYKNTVDYNNMKISSETPRPPNGGRKDESDFYPKELQYRGSPNVRGHDYDEPTYRADDEDENRVRKLKKQKRKKKKKVRPHEEDDESQFVNKGYDYMSYEMEDQIKPKHRHRRSLDQDSVRAKLPGQLSFKVKGPRGEDLGKMPIREIRHKYDDSST